jgi:hypothetical protein
MILSSSLTKCAASASLRLVKPCPLTETWPGKTAGEEAEPNFSIKRLRQAWGSRQDWTEAARQDKFATARAIGAFGLTGGLRRTDSEAFGGASCCLGARQKREPWYGRRAENDAVRRKGDKR